MKSKLLIKIAVGVAAFLCLVWASWLVAVPGTVMLDMVLVELGKSGVEAETEGLGKGFFYNIKCDSLRLVMASSGKELVTLKDVDIALVLPSLLKLKPAVEIRAGLGGGLIEGRAEVGFGGYNAISLTASGIDLSRAGLERTVTGLRAAGVAEGRVEIIRGEGEARFSADKLDFLPYSYMGFALPLDLLTRLRGLVLISPEGTEVKSLSLEGKGVYARASGNIRQGQMDLTLEIMPSEEVEQGQPYFMMIRKYKVTEGHYEIPIKTGL